jgi:phosphomannomutase/phosphoglucomutase
MIQELRRLIEAGSFREGKGELSRREVIQAYREYVRENLPIPGKLKVVVDGGNGTAGAVAPDLFREMGMEVVELFCEADGRFPNHFPDPTIPENLRALVDKVRETGADVGVAYDGDSDRIGAVDELGNVIYGDYLLVLFAREILSREPGAAIISEVKASQNLYDDIRRRGGRPVMWKAGHSLIKAKMKEEAAELAGEMSGHVFFREPVPRLRRRHLRLRPAVRDHGEGGPALERPAGRPAAGGVHARDPDRLPRRGQVPRGEGRRGGRGPPGARGHRRRRHPGLFDGGWGLVRASNTQPVLVLRFEGRDDAAAVPGYAP